MKVSTHLEIPQKERSFSTIHRCFMILGAKREDIYLRDKDYRKKYKSIYNRYEKWELEYMAKKLRKEAIKKYHPDHHSQKRQRFYTSITAEINHAYQRILHLIKYH